MLSEEFKGLFGPLGHLGMQVQAEIERLHIEPHRLPLRHHQIGRGGYSVTRCVLIVSKRLPGQAVALEHTPEFQPSS